MIESLIEYIKVTDLQTMEADEDFDLKTTMLKNQEKFIEPKINHEFIEYLAKTIKDLQNYKLNEYLLNNFQSESCVYTTLIKLYQTHFDLTYQSLFNYFHQQELNEVGVTCDAVGKFIYNQKCVFQGGNYAHYFKKLGKKKQEEIKKIIDEKTQLDTTKLDFSLSVEQLKKFFVEYNSKMTILDIHGNIIDKHHPSAERSNLSTRHFKGLVSNNHLYQITNRLETIDGEISNSIEELAQTIKTSDKYYMRKNKFIEEFLTNVEELLSYPFEENKFYKFFSVVKLDDVLHWFKEKIKYHPHVTMVDQITKITIKINKSIAIFVPFNVGLSDEFEELDCEVIGVRTDCLYFRGDESNISNNFSFGDNFGDLKPIEEVTINQLPTNSEFQYKQEISILSADTIDFDNEQKKIMNICYYQGLCDKLAKICQDTKEIYVKERFLIKKQDLKMILLKNSSRKCMKTKMEFAKFV
eukprot:gene11732-5071_t